MTDQTPDLQPIIERLEKLERQNRGLKATAVGLLVFVLLAGCGYRAPRPGPGNAVSGEGVRENGTTPASPAATVPVLSAHRPGTGLGHDLCGL